VGCFSCIVWSGKKKGGNDNNIWQKEKIKGKQWVKVLFFFLSFFNISDKQKKIKTGPFLSRNFIIATCIYRSFFFLMLFSCNFTTFIFFFTSFICWCLSWFFEKKNPKKGTYLFVH